MLKEIIEIWFKKNVFAIVCIKKNNNQSSFSNADSVIPTLGSTYNAGNLVNLVFGILRFPSGWDFLDCIRDQGEVLFVSTSISSQILCFYILVLNPIALRKARIVCNFGLSECNS